MSVFSRISSGRWLLVILAAFVIAGGAMLLARAGLAEWLLLPAAMLIMAVATLWLAGRQAPERVEEPLPDALAQQPRPHLISIDALGDPAIVLSRGWRIVATNQAAQSFLGKRLVGTDVRQTLRLPAIVDAIRIVLDGATQSSTEVGHLGSHEGSFRVRVSHPGGGAHLLLLIEDVAAAKRAESMQADFIANVSHELRTPLAGISGFIETLQGPAAEDPPARSRFLTIMAGEAARMTRLIDDLLSLSRIERDRFVRPQQPLDLAALLAESAGSFAPQLNSDARTLNLVVAESLPEVAGDRDQMLQVIHNLISNAIKYGRHGTPITVSATQVGRQDGHYICLFVEDQGEGIAPEHLPRLTERFYRVDSGRSRSMGGTGLGLAIVRHIVERHRGQIEISSRLGKGTRVSLYLPVGRAAPLEQIS